MRLLAFVVALALSGCPAPVPTQPKQPLPPTPDGGGSACWYACVNLYGLSCPEGDDVPKCVRACEATQAVSYARMRADCVAAASSVAQVRTCDVRCLGR